MLEEQCWKSSVGRAEGNAFLRDFFIKRVKTHQGVCEIFPVDLNKNANGLRAPLSTNPSTELGLQQAEPAEHLPPTLVLACETLQARTRSLVTYPTKGINRHASSAKKSKHSGVSNGTHFYLMYLHMPCISTKVFLSLTGKLSSLC